MKIILFLLLTGIAAAADWPRFRGADFSGISTETGLNTTWPATGPRQLWRADLGPGGSSVVVSDGRLFAMGNVGNQDIVYGFDAETGKELWRHAYACPLDKRSFEGGPAATPTVAGDRVFTVSHRGDVWALDAKTGKPAWSKNLVRDFKGSRPQWGFAGSPLADGEFVVLDNGGDGTSTLVLRQRDGTVVWQAGDEAVSYSSIVPATFGTTRAYLTFKARALVAQDATTGKPLWRFPWRTDWDVHATLPIVQDRRVFLASGYGAGGALLDVSGPEPQVVWRNKHLAPQMNGPVLLDGHLYGISGNAGSKAVLNCVQFATGNLQWSFPGTGCGSVAAADGKLIVLGEQGELIIGPASPKEFVPLARAQVLSERCWVVPVLANGRLYCRGNRGTLVALDLRKP
jgi:hypothetical protein